MMLTIDDALCPRCKHSLGFVARSMFLYAKCAALIPAEEYNIRANCPLFVEAEKHDCKGGSPYDVGWCTGDCKKCGKNTEWQVWVK